MPLRLLLLRCLQQSNMADEITHAFTVSTHGMVICNVWRNSQGVEALKCRPRVREGVAQDVSGEVSAVQGLPFQC